MLAALIGTARTVIERRRSLAMITQVWAWSGPAAAGKATLALPLAPVRSGSAVSVRYRTEAGDEFDLPAADVRLVASDVLPRLVPVSAWPAMARAAPDALTVTFPAGFGEAASDVPLPLRQEVLMYATALYDRREAAELPPSALGAGYGPVII
jgi:uncharacterized phiE125 gp8 family phage protein